MSSAFVVGSHQLGKQYKVMGHEVAHVSSPVSLFHAFKSRTGREKLKASLTRPFSESFQIYDDIPLVPFPYGYLENIDRINDFIVMNYLKKIRFEKPDLILMDQPAFVGVFKELQAKIKIYRPTDIYDHMHKGKHARFQSKALELCDGVIATSQEVLAALDSKKTSRVVTNGVDVSIFNSQNKNQRSGAVYIGALDERFDFIAVTLLAEHDPNLEIDLFGPSSKHVSSVLPPNCTYRGQIKYDEIPETLARYKLALLPLNKHPANKGRSPMKLFEYLAAGTPVLSSYLTDFSKLDIKGLYTYQDLDSLVLTYEDMIFDIPKLKQDDLVKAAAISSWESKAKEILTWCESTSQKF